MDNYIVHFNESDRDAVLDVLATSNDVIINKIEPTSAFITIQPDDSLPAYQALLDKIERVLQPAGINFVKASRN